MTTFVMRIVAEAPTPTGEAGILIECLCGGHRTGNRAIVRAGARATCQRTPLRIHGLVNAAWHPLALRAPSTRRYGPWRVLAR